jgi:hypothetical protein
MEKKEVRVISVTIVSRLRFGQPRNRGSISRRDKRLSLLQNVQTYSGPHPAPYSVVSKELSSGTGDRGVKPNTDLHVVPRIKTEWSYSLLVF